MTDIPANYPAMGPRMRAWHRGEYRVKPEPPPEPLDLSLADERKVAAINTMRMLAAATDRPGLRRAAYRDIGGYLRRLRDVRGRDTERFATILRRGCDLSIQRAYEYMVLAEKFSAEKSKGLVEKDEQN